MASRFDHVVIGAAHLGDAAAIVEARLGADLTGGGKHPLMATHNRLMNPAGVDLGWRAQRPKTRRHLAL